MHTYKGGNALEISVLIKNKTLIVSLAGELDHHSAKEVKDMVEEVIKNRGVQNLIFDFSKLSFMDSSGIGVVIGRYKLISAIGGNVAIVSRSRNIDRLLKMSGITKIISTYDSLKSALKTVQEEIS